MKFYTPLYVSPRIGKRQEKKILRAFKKRNPVLGIYCLCDRKDSSHLLEIMTMEELFRGYYQLDHVLVLGFAKEKEEMFVTVKKLVENGYITEIGVKGIKNR